MTTVLEDVLAAERAIRAALEANGHTVVAGEEPVWSNELATREAPPDRGRRARLRGLQPLGLGVPPLRDARRDGDPLTADPALDPRSRAPRAGRDARGRRRARPGRSRYGRRVGRHRRCCGACSGSRPRSRSARAVVRLARDDVRPDRRPADGDVHGGRRHRHRGSAQFGIDVEEIDQLELVRRAEAVGSGEARRGPATGSSANCRAVHYDGDQLTPELLERQIRSYLAMRELIDEWNLDFSGIKGQPELTHALRDDGRHRGLPQRSLRLGRAQGRRTSARPRPTWTAR